MDLGLKGKVALVTRASKGIGKAAAVALAREGCDLAICARHGDALEDAAVKMRRHQVNVLAVEADLTREPDLDRLVEQTIDTFGRVDILVNNAGRVGDGDFMSMDTQAWQNLFELNVLAVVTLTREVVPHMQRQKWGRIINISSENGEQPDPDMAAYNVTRGALDNLTKTLAMISGRTTSWPVPSRPPSSGRRSSKTCCANRPSSKAFRVRRPKRGS